MKTTDEGIPFYCSLYDSLVISVADAFRCRDMSRGSGLSYMTPAFRAYPSQHSCFGIPLKAQHCCPFLTLHVARAPTRLEK
ncbi:MAG: hypothetical protein IKQ36_04000, partial [Clostridia bacterium]|nr:hypothetical protein [Clostridia bacterium]